MSRVDIAVTSARAFEMMVIAITGKGVKSMASVVWCDNEECEYCDRSGFCTREVITIDEYGVCSWRKNEKEKGKGDDTNGQRNCITPVLLGEC